MLHIKPSAFLLAEISTSVPHVKTTVLKSHLVFANVYSHMNWKSISIHTMHLWMCLTGFFNQQGFSSMLGFYSYCRPYNDRSGNNVYPSQTQPSRGWSESSVLFLITVYSATEQPSSTVLYQGKAAYSSASISLLWSYLPLKTQHLSVPASPKPTCALNASAAWLTLAADISLS